MKKYKVILKGEIYGEVEVEAESLRSAWAKVASGKHDYEKDGDAKWEAGGQTITTVEDWFCGDVHYITMDWDCGLMRASDEAWDEYDEGEHEVWEKKDVVKDIGLDNYVFMETDECIEEEKNKKDEVVALNKNGPKHNHHHPEHIVCHYEGKDWKLKDCDPLFQSYWDGPHSFYGGDCMVYVGDGMAVYPDGETDDDGR